MDRHQLIADLRPPESLQDRGNATYVTCKVCLFGNNTFVCQHDLTPVKGFRHDLARNDVIGLCHVREYGGELPVVAFTLTRCVASSACEGTHSVLTGRHPMQHYDG